MAELALVQEVAERTWAAVGRARAEAALRASEARWRGLFTRMQEGFALCELVHDADGRPVDFRYLEVNAAWERLTALPAAAVVGRLVTEVIPGVEPFWIETYARVVETGEPAHVEYRVATLDRWFEVLAYRTEPGRFAAVFLNVTDRKRAEARQALLTREIEHRAKNALAVVQSVLRLTRAADLPAYVRAVEGRVSALARAQTLLANDHSEGAELRTLLAGELAPFLAGQRVELHGPPVLLPAVAAQPVAMAVHELATNAVKHGALSVPGGRLAVRWEVRPARRRGCSCAGWRRAGRRWRARRRGAASAAGCWTARCAASSAARWRWTGRRRGWSASWKCRSARERQAGSSSRGAWPEADQREARPAARHPPSTA